MKKYLVIGNPIEHSLSPQLHNYWIKKNNIDAFYERKQVKEDDLKEVVNDIKKEKINGINITVPFKKKIISYIDLLSPLAEEAQSVNTIYKKNNRIIGDNTDVDGFKKSLDKIKFNPQNKKAFILGAGGVALSIIIALKKMNIFKIFISNRTRKEVEILKKKFPDLEIIEWKQNCDFDLIINATSLGLKKEDKIEIDLSNSKPNKLFYDVIYSPAKTNFLLKGEKLGNQIENGITMFIFQAQLSFNIWHNIMPKVDEKVIKLLNS